MKKRFLYAVVALSVFTLVSCNSPLNRKYSDTTFPEDVKAIAESKKLSAEDGNKLAYYIMIAKFKGVKLDGKTYGELLDSAKKVVKTPGK